MAGRAPKLQTCSRKAWLLKPRSATTHFGTPGKRSRRGTAWGSSWAWPGARMKATARPSPSAITHALVPPDQVRGRLRPHANGPALHAHRAPCCWPPFFRPGRFLVSPDAGAVQKRHPELNPALLGQEQQPLPHAQVGPANKGLSRPRPGTQFSRDGPPLGSILMPPDEGRERAAQILWCGLALGPARLDQRLQVPPCSVRQHRSSSHQEEQNARHQNQFKREQALAATAHRERPDCVNHDPSLPATAYYIRGCALSQAVSPCEQTR